MTLIATQCKEWWRSFRKMKPKRGSLLNTWSTFRTNKGQDFVSSEMEWCFCCHLGRRHLDTSSVRVKMKRGKIIFIWWECLVMPKRPPPNKLVSPDKVTITTIWTSEKIVIAKLAARQLDTEGSQQAFDLTAGTCSCELLCQLAARNLNCFTS